MAKTAVLLCATGRTCKLFHHRTCGSLYRTAQYRALNEARYLYNTTYLAAMAGEEGTGASLKFEEVKPEQDTAMPQEFDEEQADIAMGGARSDADAKRPKHEVWHRFLWYIAVDCTRSDRTVVRSVTFLDVKLLGAGLLTRQLAAEIYGPNKRLKLKFSIGPQIPCFLLACRSIIFERGAP